MLKKTLPAIIFSLSSPTSLLLPVPIFLDRLVPSARVAGRLCCNDIYTPFYTSSLSLIEELLSSSLFSCLKCSTSFFELPSLTLRYPLNPARETFKSRDQDAEQTHDGLLRDRLPLRLLRWTPDRLLVDGRECDTQISHHFQCRPTSAPQAVSSNQWRCKCHICLYYFPVVFPGALPPAKSGLASCPRVACRVLRHVHSGARCRHLVHYSAIAREPGCDLG